MKILFGLGNPGEEYKKTRHNAGQIVMSFVENKLQDEKIKFIIPDTFMNLSGKAVVKVVKNTKDLKNLIVIYDDIDLPLGKIKISFDRSSGGHNGVASVIKALKTQEFLRIRVGIAPTTPTGKIKKPKGEDAVHKFLLGEFKKTELEELKKISKKVAEAILVIENDTKEKAMTLFN
jgi:PTH1 family peptidyl-tRNA hydrolase